MVQNGCYKAQCASLESRLLTRESFEWGLIFILFYVQRSTLSFIGVPRIIKLNIICTCPIDNFNSIISNHKRILHVVLGVSSFSTSIKPKVTTFLGGIPNTTERSKVQGIVPEPRVAIHETTQNKIGTKLKFVFVFVSYAKNTSCHVVFMFKIQHKINTILTYVCRVVFCRLILNLNKLKVYFILYFWCWSFLSSFSWVVFVLVKQNAISCCITFVSYKNCCLVM